MRLKSFFCLCGVAALYVPAIAPVIAQDDARALESFVRANAASRIQSSMAQKLESMTDNLEVTITGMEDGKPSYRLLKVQPLMDDEENGAAAFVQASISRADGRNTGNIGLAYRKLVNNNTVILGLNGFYDNEWTYDHERASTGLEVLSSVGDVRVNRYWALSDLERGKNDALERALDGFDVELAVPVPYLPRTKMHVKSFKYEGNGSTLELEGDTFSVRSDLPFGFTLEAGSTSYDANRPDQDYVSLSLNMSLGKTAGTGDDSGAFVINQPYQLAPIKERRFEKVRRSNTITKEVGGALIVTVIGV